MATFQELVSRVSDELIDVPDRTQNHLETFVRQAIRKFQFRHDFNICKTSTAVLTTTAGTNVLSSVPSDFLRFRKELPHIIDNQGNVIELGVSITKQQAEREFGTVDGGEFSTDTLEGCPKVLTMSEALDVAGTRNFLVYPLPDALSLYTTAPAGAYRIRVPYIKLLPALSGSNSNWFTTNAEEYIAYAATSVGFFFNHDEARGEKWLQRAAQEVQDVLARDKNEAVSGNTTLHVSFDALDSKIPQGDAGSYRGFR